MKIILNRDYFKTIDSNEKAYFLGLLISDGCNTRNGFHIAFQEEDGYLLEKFLISMNCYNKPLSIMHDNKTMARKLQKGFKITSKSMSEDLTKLGCMPAKSHKTYFPPIEEKYWSHFIRGVFDGDGCITFHKSPKKKTAQKFFSIKGNITLIGRIQEILIEKCGLNKTKLLTDKNLTTNIVNLMYAGNRQVEKIRHYLYQDCEDFCLKRKEKKFKADISDANFFYSKQVSQFS